MNPQSVGVPKSVGESKRAIRALLGQALGRLDKGPCLRVTVSPS
jgi:hypothetical protein